MPLQVHTSSLRSLAADVCIERSLVSPSMVLDTPIPLREEAGGSSSSSVRRLTRVRSVPLSDTLRHNNIQQWVSSRNRERSSVLVGRCDGKRIPSIHFLHDHTLILLHQHDAAAAADDDENVKKIK